MQLFFVTRQLIVNRSLWLGIGLFFVAVACFAQTPENHDEIVCTIIVEHPPEFPGGYKALMNYFQTTIHYPIAAKKARVMGRVFVNFIVETDGTLTDIQLLKGLGYGCDEEAIRVIKAMPRWIPGSQSGRLIRVRYNLPILFGTDYSKTKVR